MYAGVFLEIVFLDGMNRCKITITVILVILIILFVGGFRVFTKREV